MIINVDVWNQFVQAHWPDHVKKPKSFREMILLNSAVNEALFPENIKQVLSCFVKAYHNDNLNKVICDNSAKSPESIILMAKLHAIDGALSVCEKLNNIGLENFFCWKKNGGLHLKEAYFFLLKDSGDNTGLDIDYLSERDLFHLLDVLKVCCERMNEQNIQSLFLKIHAYYLEISAAHAGLGFRGSDMASSLLIDLINNFDRKNDVKYVVRQVSCLVALACALDFVSNPSEESRCQVLRFVSLLDQKNISSKQTIGFFSHSVVSEDFVDQTRAVIQSTLQTHALQVAVGF